VTYLRLGSDGPVPPSDVPPEDSLGVLVELRDQGLIRRIGLSGASPQMLARAQKMTPIAAVQNRFNLLDRSGVQVLADCEAQGIIFVPLRSSHPGSIPAIPKTCQQNRITSIWLVSRCSIGITTVSAPIRRRPMMPWTAGGPIHRASASMACCSSASNRLRSVCSVRWLFWPFTPVRFSGGGPIPALRRALQLRCRPESA
jgi:hypothetical protein